MARLPILPPPPPLPGLAEPSAGRRPWTCVWSHNALFQSGTYVEATNLLRS